MGSTHQQGLGKHRGLVCCILRVMKSRVYVETSVVSFYHEVRTEPDMIARRDWTRQFWDNAENYELVTSIAVLDEIENGNFPSKSAVIDLVSSLPILPIESGIGEIVDTYVSRKVMPADPRGDALHLAWHHFTNASFC